MKKIRKLFFSFILCCLLIATCELSTFKFQPVTEVNAATVKMNKTKLVMLSGNKYTLKLNVGTKGVSWSSNNKKIATVNSKGVVTAKSAGNVKIQAIYKSKRYYCTIKVETPKISKTKLTLNPKQSYQLKVSGTQQKVSWSSSNSKIVTVNSKGYITAKKAGTAKIQAIVSGRKLFCTITVKKPAVEVTRIEISPSQITIPKGKEYFLNVIYYPETAKEDGSASFTSSNTNVATVDNYGIVYARNPGRATITVKYRSLVATCQVTITENSSAIFPWRNYPVMAHALGAVNGQVYLNSKESFIQSYNKGFRLFEVDLQQTSDGVWVCRHNWNEPLGQWSGGGKKVLSCKEFLSKPLYGKYTPMSLKDLFVLLKKYPDAYILFDTKKYAQRDYSMTLKDYSEYVKIAEDAGAKETLKRIIPQVYNESMYPAVASMRIFPTYLYSLWKQYSVNELIHVADFCQEKGIPAVTISQANWSKSIQQFFDTRGILLYVYTVNNINDAKTYMYGGAAGICTDMITKEELF